MNVLPVPRSVYGRYFVHVLAVYLQCTSPVHHPLPPVIAAGELIPFNIVDEGRLLMGGEDLPGYE